MAWSKRTLGGLALAGASFALGVLAAPAMQPLSLLLDAGRSAITPLGGYVMGARAEKDPILLYRDPMGEPKVSREPIKDWMGMDYLPVRRSEVAALLSKLENVPDAPPGEAPLFYRDPMGGSDVSPTPKRDSMGMDYLPVYPSEIARVLPPLGEAPASSNEAAPANGQRRVLYYRNPMGLPDTSPVPKKDSMGMDYIPVYEGEDEGDATIKVAVEKIQRAGVRSEPVTRRVIDRPIRVPGTIQLDERRIAVVTMRSEAFVEKVDDVTTGDRVGEGQPLMRVYSPEIASAGALYLSVLNEPARSGPAVTQGARRRLENLSVPAEVIAEIERTRKVPMSFDWPAPREGVVLERTAIDGMRAMPGEVLFRLADLSTIWVLADVAERDFAMVRPDQTVAVRPRALPDRTFSGRVVVVYPQMNKETRSARVRIELPNPDGLLRPDMYVDVEIGAGEDDPVLAAPDSAVIDSGTRQLVIIDKGEGRFEPREVELGRRGDGYVEVRQGLSEGDQVVVAANFLIDAESNLRAALRGLEPEAGR